MKNMLNTYVEKRKQQNKTFIKYGNQQPNGANE
jgi:hypothetical protein